MKLSFCFVLFLVVPIWSSAFAFNCTSLQGAEQRLRDETFAQPLAAYYKHLYIEKGNTCDSKDLFIILLNHVFKAQNKMIQYEDLCKAMHANGIPTELVVRLNGNEGFYYIHTQFNEHNVQPPGYSLIEGIIYELSNNTPYCGKVFHEFQAVLDGAAAEMLHDEVYRILLYYPEKAVQMLPYLQFQFLVNWKSFSYYLINNNEYTKIKQRYETFLSNNSKYKNNALYILDWINKRAVMENVLGNKSNTNDN